MKKEEIIAKINQITIENPGFDVPKIDSKMKRQPLLQILTDLEERLKPKANLSDDSSIEDDILIEDEAVVEVKPAPRQASLVDCFRQFATNKPAFSKD